MKQLTTYFRYFWEFLKHGDLVSIISSASYLLFRKSHGKDRIIKSSIGTFYCRKKTNDFQFANYKYEWGVKKYLLDNLHTFSVFIDGGSCIGDYCILLSQYNKRCIAFEPVMQNFNTLNKNLELNKLTKEVLTFPYGLGAKNEQPGFVFNPVNTGASHIAKNGEAGNCIAEIRTFDSVFHSLNIIPDEHILMKLDLEGMEPEAIIGAKNFIIQCLNITLVIEVKHVGEEPVKSALNKIATFEYGIVDAYNIFARKITTPPFN